MRRARRHPCRMRVRGLGNSAKGRKGEQRTLHTLLKQKTSHLHKTSAQCVWRGLCVCVCVCVWKHLRICMHLHVGVSVSIYISIGVCKCLFISMLWSVFVRVSASACGYASGRNPPAT